MTIMVNQDLCKGCGICMDVCSCNAITMKDHKAFIDQEICTSCEICVNACPAGAIQLSTSISPVVFRKPEVIEVTELDTSVEYYPKKPGWGQTMLLFVGRYVLPTLVNTLTTYFERKQSSTIQENISSYKNPVGTRPFQRRKQRRGRYS